MTAMRFFCFAFMMPAAIMVGLVANAAEAFPSKPMRIVTGDPGGGADFAARLIAQGLGSRVKQTVLVENRGGSPVIHAGIVSKAQPDGYTLLLYAQNFWLLPLLQDNVPYDTLRDFAPITSAVSSPTVLVVNPALPVKSVREFISYASARPGALNYSTAAAGSSQHLAAELFNAMAGIKTIRVAYKGGGPALTAVMSGEVQLMFAPVAPVKPLVQSGKLLALAITSAQPSRLFPDLPTVAASGLPQYEFTSAWGMFAPAHTPKGIVDALNQHIVQVLNNAEVSQKFLASGVEVVGNSPTAFAGTIKSDITVIGKVIKDAGIRGD